MELFARLGVVWPIPELEKQVNELQTLLEEGDGLFMLRLSHPYFREWVAYTGLALEADWRSEKRRQNDLTFQSLLIVHLH